MVTQGLRSQIAAGSATLALVVAVAAFLWLVFWPYSYRGEVVTELQPGGTQQRSTEYASMLQMNGRGVLIPLSVPVALAGIGSWSAGVPPQRRWGRWLLWAAIILSWGFCFLAIFSVGLYYMPSAVLLTVAALLR